MGHRKIQRFGGTLVFERPIHLIRLFGFDYPVPGTMKNPGRNVRNDRRSFRSAGIYWSG